MTELQNSLFYAASIIEHTARLSKNKRSVIAEKLGIEGIQAIITHAEASHCLPFSQVADELVSDYEILPGKFSPESELQKVPSASEIGKVYMRLVEDVQPDPEKYAEELYTVLHSRISEWMTAYNSAFFYSPRDYVLECYREMRNK